MGRLFKVLEWIILGAVFYGLFTPMSMLYRLMGRDLLRRRLNGSQKSYWLECSQSKLSPKDFYTQFIGKRII